MKSANIIGSKVTVIIGGSIVCLSVIATSFMRKPVLFFIFYAFLFGIGKGFIYPAPLRASWSHLPGRKGFVSGVIVSGLGLGAFMYGILVNLLVNPLNKSPVKTEIKPNVFEYIFENDVTDNVPRMLLILGILWII
jgi:MFS family permease